MSRTKAERIRRIFVWLTGAGTVFGAMAVARSYLSGTEYQSKEEMFGKTVVITGANRGIGKETAKELAKRGAKVVLACKDMKMCDEVRREIVDETFNKNVHCMECDLASLKSIREFVNQFNQSS